MHSTYRHVQLDLEAALNFAVSALSNAAAFWNQCSPEQKPRFQRVLFPDGLVFDGESYRTATTCLAFRYLQGFGEGNSSLASRKGIEPVSPPPKIELGALNASHSSQHP